MVNVIAIALSVLIAFVLVNQFAIVIHIVIALGILLLVVLLLVFALLLLLLSSFLVFVIVNSSLMLLFGHTFDCE